MLYCELAEMYPISDSVRCQDCSEFKFCPVINDDVGDSDE